MMTMHKREQIPTQYQNLQFYADLSQYTLQKRKNLNTITKVLRNHKIIYRWGYPTKLSIVKEGHTHIVESLEKGLSLLEEWKIFPERTENQNSARPARQIEPDWKKVTNKNTKSHN